ncbi:ferritin-like domain-containing protein [Frigoriglobus tundricola]|uniref:Iminophenyl-pyruvate dimer synthase domain-containing protein n=1 Tax=Frigoriglobus tundricola TaxID=2774151 RepID=A0A6M5YHN0_9BACT|nr:ferritin-like protein [Frigoriglobus tundricola]QJW93565.1 hypothetical protein FTUN_1072 [Frigoriglobus tundricola]
MAQVITSVRTAHAAAPLAPAPFDLRDMLARPDEDRDEQWLVTMLRFAVQLEFATIPPYLTAYWSVKDTTTSPAPNILLLIVLQEMLHMGLVCNILNSLGQPPVIAHPSVVPTYPGHLPGRVHPTLWVALRPLSKDVVGDTFMVIEEPHAGSVRYAFGQTFPTIGAFYTAIEDCIRKQPGLVFSGQKQLVLTRPDFPLPAIATAAALSALDLIKQQGEGADGGPLYGPSPADLAHYFLFGQIYYEKALVQVAPNDWQYTGDAVPFPRADEIYPMAPVPPAGYADSLPFDRKFTQMLFQLQKAWELGGPAGGAELLSAQETMGELGDLAVRLMTTPVAPGSAQTMGPCFRFVPPS